MTLLRQDRETRGWRAAIALPFGLFAYALTSHVSLLVGWPLSTWLFPGCLLFGAAAASFCAAPECERAVDSDARVWRIVPWLALLFLAIAIGFLIYGAVATADRSWDGLVAWTPRALHLAPPADLTQPYFSNLAVYAHSRNYPLLQPLCLGACQSMLGPLAGRLFFPLVFLGFLSLVHGVARAQGMSRGHAWTMTVAFGFTPMWYSSGSGAVDSGYADLLLGYCLALGGAGVLLQRPMLLVCGAFCLPLVKPEGLPYSVLLCLVTLCGAPGRRLHLAATLSLVAALLLWLPLQVLLTTVKQQAVLWPLALGAVLVGLNELKLWLAPSNRAMTIGAIAVGVLGCGLAIGLRAQILDAPDMVLREFAANLADLRRLDDLPELLLGYLDGFLFMRKFGLLFPMLFFLFLCKRGAVGPSPSRALAGLFLGGVTMACLAVFLSSEPDLAHEFKSRFDRLLLHWVGVGWLLLGPWSSRLLARPGLGPSAGA